MKSIFKLAENLSLALTNLDNELGLAQPQLVLRVPRHFWVPSTVHLEEEYFEKCDFSN